MGIQLSADHKKSDELNILAENWPVVCAFMLVQTQWRVSASGHITGLDYASCKMAIKAHGLSWRKVFSGLQIMEAEVLASQH